MSAMILRVKDWGRLYENNRTRDLKAMQWVPIPNRMDGDGYTELVDHESGAAHLGAWLAMVQIASRCHPRGTLVRDDGRPHTPQSLARISRLPATLFDEALPRLIRIGWLESYRADNCRGFIDTHEVAAEPQRDAEIPQDGAISPQDGDHEGKEWKEQKEQKEGTERARVLTFSAPESGIHEFLNAYPKKTNRDAATRAYLSVIETAEEHARLMAGLRRWLDSDQWHRSLKDNSGRYVPNPGRFIANRLYVDEPAPFGGEGDDTGGTEVDVFARVARQVLSRENKAA
ncbi:MAG: hypothetical protein IT169_09105 [Bryobacterales bacterium]|nr:hypothetical protein [Bryobacterales bacterium]